MSSIQRRHLYRARAISVHLVLLAVACPCDGSTRSVPTDFSVQAAFFPGGGLSDYKDSQPWRLRITRDGKAIQEISIIGTGAGVREVRKSFLLSEEHVRALATVVEQENFFALPNQISTTEFVHHGGCVLKITMARRTHRVEFVWPTDEKATHKRRELTRFWKIWQTVLKKVPSPNHNSEAVWWLHHVRPDLVGQRR